VPLIIWPKGVLKYQVCPEKIYLETQLPAESRLPQNFKTFDFFDEKNRVANSAKTLDTTTVAKMSNPHQIYSSIKRNIDEAAEFTKYGLKGRTVDSSLIISRELQVAIPKSTTKDQWIEINKAIEYGQSRGVTVKITKVD
jgi:filamentous hemagglutinin